MTDKPKYKSLRDEFAMAALPVILPYLKQRGDEVDGFDDLSKYCYFLADAMMEEREKKQ